MDIKTKHNRGEEVYYFDGKRLCKCKIHNIKIYVSRPERSDKDFLDIRYNLFSGKTLTENDLHKSKEDLIAALTESISKQEV